MKTALGAPPRESDFGRKGVTVPPLCKAKIILYDLQRVPSKEFLFGENPYLLYCWSALDLPEVQSVLYGMQISCPKKCFPCDRCHTHTMVHLFLSSSTSVGHKYTEPKFPNLLTLKSMSGYKLVVRKVLHTLQQYLIWQSWSNFVGDVFLLTENTLVHVN